MSAAEPPEGGAGPMTGSTVKVEHLERARQALNMLGANHALAPVPCVEYLEAITEKLALAFAEQEQAVTEAVERRVREECAMAARYHASCTDPDCGPEQVIRRAAQPREGAHLEQEGAE